MEQQIGSELGKEYIKALYCHPAYLTSMQSTPCEMPGWVNHKLESKIGRRNINNLRYADDTTLMAESEEELKSFLMKVKEESEKSWLKTQHSENEDHSIWSHHFMANRWGNSGNSDRLIFWGSKVTADGDCSHEIKRHLLLGRKAMTSLDSILKSKDNTLPTKVCLVKAMVFLVVMYGCQSWSIKKTEHRRIDAFEL